MQALTGWESERTSLLACLAEYLCSGAAVPQEITITGIKISIANVSNAQRRPFSQFHNFIE